VSHTRRSAGRGYPPKVGCTRLSCSAKDVLLQNRHWPWREEVVDVVRPVTGQRLCSTCQWLCWMLTGSCYVPCYVLRCFLVCLLATGFLEV
jgi:hypothetical protein